MYTLSASILIAVLFHEHPGPAQYVAGVVLMTGLVMASASSDSHKDQREKAPEAEEEESAEKSNSQQVKEHNLGSAPETGSTSDVDIMSSEGDDIQVVPPRLMKRSAAMAIMA